MREFKGKFWTRKRSRQVFIFLMLLIPVSHFIFTWALNLNMIPMAFKNYTTSISGEFWGWDKLFENFQGIFRLYNTTDNMYNEWYALRNSLMVGGLSIFVLIPATLFFSYLLYMKMPGYKVWQVLMYVPCITSAIVLVLVYRSFVVYGPFDSILNRIGLSDIIPYEGWLSDKYAWTTIMIFNVWTGVSNNIVYYLSAMRRIPTEFMEAARMDGATEYQIFFKIVLPMVASSVLTLTLMGLGGIVSWGAISLMMMDSSYGICYTGSIGLSLLNWSTSRAFGTAAAYGLMITIIYAPIVIVLRKAIDKITAKIEG